MIDTTYNGWTNYETWQAALWLSEADMQSIDSDELEYFVREVLLGEQAFTGNGLLSDVATSWFHSVNFKEIARNNQEG